MSTSNLLTLIDAQIATLRQARELLTTTDKPTQGRLEDSTNAPAKRKRKSGLTPEGRARIAAAVRARWAKQRKAAKA